MELKQAHKIVKETKIGKDGYVNVLTITRSVLGHQAKTILGSLPYDDEIFLGLRLKGDVNNHEKWLIEWTDAVDFILRIEEYAEKSYS